MKKFFLGTFILFDLALIGGGAFVLFSYVKDKIPAHSFPRLSGPAVVPSPVAPSTGKALSGGLLAPSSTNESSTRKILFSYRNPHARQVSIRADFTGWKAAPMLKAPNGQWTYLSQLTPGEYAYCFTVDDKTFKDPANKRT